MKSKFPVLILIAALIAIVGGFLFSPKSNFPNTGQTSLTKLLDDCKMPVGQLSTICAVRNGAAVNLDASQLPKCGETIVVKVSLTDFMLTLPGMPDFYYLCSKGTRLSLEGAPSSAGDLKFYNYDANTNTEFSCSDKVYWKYETHFFANVGKLPAQPGNVIFFDLYAYPKNFTFSTVGDFMNNADKAIKIVSLDGDIAC